MGHRLGSDLRGFAACCLAQAFFLHQVSQDRASLAVAGVDVRACQEQALRDPERRLSGSRGSTEQYVERRHSFDIPRVRVRAPPQQCLDHLERLPVSGIAKCGVMKRLPPFLRRGSMDACPPLDQSQGCGFLDPISAQQGDKRSLAFIVPHIVPRPVPEQNDYFLRIVRLLKRRQSPGIAGMDIRPALQKQLGRLRPGNHQRGLRRLLAAPTVYIRSRIEEVPHHAHVLLAKRIRHAVATPANGNPERGLAFARVGIPEVDSVSAVHECVGFGARAKQSGN